MRESFLKLNDRTVVLSGPLTQVTSALVTTLSERGADIAMIVSDNLRESQRFAENISEQREIHHNYGRVAAIESQMDSAEAGSDAISRAAEIFGTIDILIDTHLIGINKTAENFSNYNDRATHMAKAALPYLEGRQKGRIILVTNDFHILEEKQKAPVQSLIRELSQSVIEKHITANVISCGVTEEYLLSRFNGKVSIKDALEKVKSEHKNVRMVDAVEIASVITFISSPMSSGINGQTIVVNGGMIL
ncbi:MAG: SDR family oxidoreductase [Bdellovibrionales bacterium]|nr:SDR family oxidoreductase [Bdellovibrionales bacterium]